MQTDKKNLQKMIDHTLLKPDATKNKSKYAVKQRNGFASVCVNSYYTDLVSNELKGSDVKTCVVVGFPLGAMLTDVKSVKPGSRKNVPRKLIW